MEKTGQSVAALVSPRKRGKKNKRNKGKSSVDTPALDLSALPKTETTPSPLVSPAPVISDTISTIPLLKNAETAEVATIDVTASDNQKKETDSLAVETPQTQPQGEIVVRPSLRSNSLGSASSSNDSTGVSISTTDSSETTRSSDTDTLVLGETKELDEEEELRLKAPKVFSSPIPLPKPPLPLGVSSASAIPGTSADAESISPRSSTRDLIRARSPHLSEEGLGHIVRSRSGSMPTVLPPTNDFLDFINESLDLNLHGPKRRTSKIRMLQEQSIGEILAVAKRQLSVSKGDYVLYVPSTGIYLSKEMRTLRSYMLQDGEEIELVAKKDRAKLKTLKVNIHILSSFSASSASSGEDTPHSPSGFTIINETVEFCSNTTIKGLIQSLDKQPWQNSGLSILSSYALYMKDQGSSFLDESSTLKAYSIKRNAALDYRPKAEGSKSSGPPSPQVKSRNLFGVRPKRGATTSTTVTASPLMAALSSLQNHPPSATTQSAGVSTPPPSSSISTPTLSLSADSKAKNSGLSTSTITTPVSVPCNSPSSKVKRLSGRFILPGFPSSASSASSTSSAAVSTSTSSTSVSSSDPITFNINAVFKSKNEPSVTRVLTITSVDTTADVWTKVRTAFSLSTQEEYRLRTSSKRRIPCNTEIFFLACHFRPSKEDIILKRARGGRRNRRSMQVNMQGCVSAEVIQRLLDFIEANGGMDKEGIFRVSGNALKVTTLHRTCVQNDPHLEGVSVHDVSSALKMYLREFPEPVVPHNLFHTFMDAYRVPRSEGGELVLDEEKRAEQHDRLFRKAIRELPEANRHVLTLIITFLRRLSEHSAVTLMDADNLGKVFGPTLFRAPKEPASPGPSSPSVAPKEHYTRVSTLVTSFNSANLVGEVASYLINHSEILEEEDTALISSTASAAAEPQPNDAADTETQGDASFEKERTQPGEKEESQRKSRSTIGIFKNRFVNRNLRARTIGKTNSSENGTKPESSSVDPEVNAQNLLKEIQQISQYTPTEVHSLATKIAEQSAFESFKSVAQRELGVEGLFSLVVELSRTIAMFPIPSTENNTRKSDEESEIEGDETTEEDDRPSDNTAVSFPSTLEPSSSP